MTHHHIQVVAEEDIPGKIYAIGDVHGALSPFQEVLNILRPEDTLIIVGDLADRGESEPNNPTSAQILDTLIEYKNSPTGTHPQIYCVKGNHEMDLLLMLHLLVHEPSAPNTHNMLGTFFRNGGGWICRHDSDNVKQQERLLTFRSYSCGDKTPECLEKVKFFIKELLKSPDVFSELIPNLRTYGDFIRTLPFVIKIEGDHPALVVHADLNFSDEEIDDRIRSGKDFSMPEINYMTNTRVNEIAPEHKRDENATLVLVGHNMIDDPSDLPTGRPPINPVRPETNHINLDGAAYFSQGLLLLNLTDNQIEIVGKNISAENQVFLNSAKNAIQDHLDNRPNANKRRRFN